MHFNCIFKVWWSILMDSRQLKPLFHHFTVSFYPITVIHYLLDITRCKTNIHHQVSPTIEGLARYPWDVWHIFIFAGQLGCWQCTGWCSSVHSVGLSASRPWKPLRTIEKWHFNIWPPKGPLFTKGLRLFPQNKFVISNVNVLQIGHNIIVRQNTLS